MLFKYRIVNVYLLLALAVVVNCRGTVNTPCKVKNTGASGVCKVDLSCPKAQEDAKKGIAPTICEILVGSILIVCCEGATVTKVEVSDNSFLHAEDNDNSDRIIFDSAETANHPLSQRKCLEYNSKTVELVQVIPLLTNPKPSNTFIPKCKFDGQPLIVGGKPALPGEFPFMAVLGYTTTDSNVQWICGGTLISDLYVMTAAHCINTKHYGRPVLVRLGELDLTKEDDNSLSEDFGVAEVIPHPDYNPTTKYNDIGLIKLSKKVTFNSFIRPACLWDDYTVKQSSAIATGWGVTKSGGSQSNVLQKVSLDLLNTSTCDRTYGNIQHFKNGLPKTMLCAGKLEGGQDTCQGDSGGPLTITKGNQCIFYTVGVTSFGRMCALSKTPAVYTRVSEFVSWIEKIVWE